ncbi:MAG: ATP-binding protein, partial [Candidatus Borkfalkia sp.]
MIRKIIKIDEEKCNGCGLCAAACHEGAIGMAGGKAKLLREDYCDGLGDCLPAFSRESPSRLKRAEAPAMHAAAVARAKTQTLPCGCPSAQSKKIERRSAPETANEARSELSQWPVQIKLVSVNAPYFQGARLLVAADCTAYACGDFHGRFIRGRVTLVGCPKLDMADYSEKLSEILKAN